MYYYKKYNWEEEYINQAKNIFINTYKNDYCSTTTVNNDNINENINEDDFFYELFGGNDNNNDHISNEFEMEDYLNKPVAEVKIDPLKWWKVNCNLIFF